jgi:O-antigen/teichoic acid export membrane protein
MIRNIATLLSGNALSQAVNVLTILFVVTALYTPDQFGRYSVVMAYVGILSSIACMRFELAIVSVPRESAASNMTAVSLVTAACFSLLVLGMMHAGSVLWGPGFLLGVSPAVIAILVFLKAGDQVFASVLYRRERYLSVSLLKLLQAAILFAGFYLAGRSGYGVTGLVMSTLVAYGAFAIASALACGLRRMSRGVRVSRMIALAKRSGDFVRFSMPQTLIDNLLTNGLNFVLVGLAGPTAVGYFNFMVKTLKAPLALVFGAVSQVVFRHSAKFIGEPVRLGQELRRISRFAAAMLAVSFAAVIAVRGGFDYLAVPEEWAGLRDYLLPFAVWMLAPFLFSPFATLPVVFGRQKRFFQLATTFNLLSLAVLSLIMMQGNVATAFWIVGFASIPYFLAMNAWLLTVVDDARAG